MNDRCQYCSKPALKHEANKKVGSVTQHETSVWGGAITLHSKMYTCISLKNITRNVVDGFGGKLVCTFNVTQ